MSEGARVIAVGLDGFETSIAENMMAEGRLPTFRMLREKATQFRLHHGDARETGLAWEHFSTGKSPEAYARWSAVDFNPSTYFAGQADAPAVPFLAETELPVLAFDVPYMDLSLTRNTTGMSNWGAHDPGVRRESVPVGLEAEIIDMFGEYPAKEYIYGFVWPSAEAADEMADRLIEATRRRARIIRWLARDRVPDWRLAITVVAELHSALEALWHGWDKSHPLHDHPSAAAARRGIEGVYEETDALIRGLHEDHPDAQIVAFSMHGMGPNKADLPSMVLLPELLFRRAYGSGFLHPRTDWDAMPPHLDPGEFWGRAIKAQLGVNGPAGESGGIGGRLRRRSEASARKKIASDIDIGIPWMPAAQYAPFWPGMDAFALPAYYDGQIRVNLKGRERDGMVPVDRYHALLDELEALLSKVRDPFTGDAVVRSFERPLADDPFGKSETRCDLKVLWSRNAYAFDAPDIGRIGPVPQRRTGGHTGDYGYAAILGPDRMGRNDSVASSFDIVPTLLTMAGAQIPAGLSGDSLL